MTKRTTSLDRFLESEIHQLSERTDEDLRIMLRLLERAYLHIKIEQNLRAPASRT